MVVLVLLAEGGRGSGMGLDERRRAEGLEGHGLGVAICMLPGWGGGRRWHRDGGIGAAICRLPGTDGG